MGSDGDWYAREQRETVARLRAQMKQLQENGDEMSEEQDDDEKKDGQDDERDEQIPWTR